MNRKTDFLSLLSFEGVGINPPLSAMKHAWNLKQHTADCRSPNKVHLLYSASSINELVFQVRMLLCYYRKHM